MVTAASWLNELGAPPPVICQDWSHQLQKRGRSNSKHASHQVLAPLNWEDIEVSDTGLLSVREEASSYAADSLIEQLLEWSRPSTDISSSKAQFKSACEVRAMVESSTASDTPVATLAEVGTALAVTQSVAAIPAANQRRQVKGKRSSIALLLTHLKPHRVAALVAVGLVAFSMLGWLFLSSPSSKSPSTPALALKKSSKNSSEQSSAPERASAVAAHDSVSAEDLSIANMAPLPTINDVLGGQAANSVPTIEPQRFDLSGVITSPLPPSSAREALETAAESQGGGGAIADAIATENSVDARGPSAPAAGSDVMRDVAEMTASAEAGEKETELPAAKSEDAKSKSLHDPIVLRTSPMIQTYMLPGTLARPREPVWSITMAVDDEFKVQPREPQRLHGKQTLTWLLSNADAKSPVTKLVIQVQAAPGRQTGLRWRVAASAEDLPALALPVAKEPLQLLQRRVLNYVESTRAESARLSAVSQSAETDIRAMISKQRKALDAQNKLASRVATVASEAQLLDDFLRSQVTLYVELFDGEKANLPLLQFGDPQQLLAPSESAPEGGVKSETQADLEQAK